MNVLDNAIKNRDFKNIYLIFGEEKYLKNLYEKKMTDTLVPVELKAMNFDILEGKTTDVSKIQDIADTMPFMNDYRLLIIKNSQLFYEGRKLETEKLIKYLENIPKTTVIIFFEDNVDKRLKIFKEIKKIGDICEFSNLNESELCKYIFDFLEKNNKKIDNETAIFFIRNIGTSLEIINNELEKLINYKSSEKITKDDINEICTKSIETKIFELIDAMGNKNSEIAIEIYKNLLLNKTSPFLILAMISRQFRILLQVKYLYKKNESILGIAKALQLREFIIKDALKQGRNFTIKILLEAINECLEIDNKIKTGILQDEMAIELLIIKYSIKKD